MNEHKTGKSDSATPAHTFSSPATLMFDLLNIIIIIIIIDVVVNKVGRNGLAVAYLTAVREVLGSNRAVGSCVYRKTTVIYSLGHGLCAPLLQCLSQLSLLPSVGR